MSWAAVAIGGSSIIGGVLASNKKAPQVAPAVPVDLQAEQSKAIKGNLANQDQIEQLLSRSDAYSQGQASKLMEQALPGYSKLSQTLLGRYQQQAQDPYSVPKDVQDNLTRIAAERGINRGTAGQTNQYSLLRDLGVNELQYGQSNLQGALAGLTSLTGMAPRVSPASPLSFYVTPGMAAQTAQSNNMNQQNVAQGAYNAQAAAGNANSQSMWDGILKGVGAFVGGGGLNGFGGTGGMSNYDPQTGMMQPVNVKG
jgi:hypothetical protein